MNKKRDTKLEKEGTTRSVSSIVIILSIIFFAVLVMAAPSWNSAAGGVYPVTEDTFFTWNFSDNVTDPDNVAHTFSFNSINITTNSDFDTEAEFYWVNLNATTGVMTINATLDNETGLLTTVMTVVNGSGSGATEPFYFNITSTNDPPVFVGLDNQSFNMSSQFNYTFNITDEEDNSPFNYTVDFLSCVTAQWSWRNSSDCTLFDLSNIAEYSFNNISEAWINISFTPDRNDVGDYSIMFNVTDYNSNVTPFNATTSHVVNFTVLVINEPPYFRYTCDDERNATENLDVSCFINASDIDETTEISFMSNFSWFFFNRTQTMHTAVTTNITYEYNASALVNFTPTDSQVGNWSINITINDTGSPTGINSTQFWFFIENENDTLFMKDVYNMTVYTSNTQALFSVNASDDDILIPDENVYNETHTYTPNITGIFTVGVYELNSNTTQANFSYDPNDLGVGSHMMNITVRDRGNFSIGFKIFNITVVDNTAPSWDQPLMDNFSVTEDVEFYINLSENITDSNGDTLTFSNNSILNFPSFFFNTTTGEVNFTPIDQDVGIHFINLTVTDGITSNTTQFNFTIVNVNDAPNISQITGNRISPTPFYNGSHVNTTEDADVTFFVDVTDDDLLIPGSSETITLTQSIIGPNTTLLSFDSGQELTDGTIKFEASFTAGKPDVGIYNISFNGTDGAGINSSIFFNFTINQTQHAPVLTTIGNINSSILGNFSTDINTTDIEDINETFAGSNLTYTLVGQSHKARLLLNHSANISSDGVFNFTFNQTYAGVLEFNITVNDSTNEIDYELFNISVYDYPQFNSPVSTFVFNLAENTTASLNFTVNHSVGDRLNYTLIINGEIKNSTFEVGNGTEFMWNFTAAFGDQTSCSGTVNLTLNATNPELSNFTSWNITINNTNSPLSLSTNIPDLTGTSPQELTLSSYYTDADAVDVCLNQTIGFTVTRTEGDTSITVSVVNWTASGTPTATFTASEAAEANFSIVAQEYTNSSYNSTILRNVTSNNFTVEITLDTSPTPTPSPSGGGSSSKKTPISLKILVPEPVSAKKKDRLVVPLGVWNDGEVTLNEIILDGVVAKNGILRTDLIASFDTSFITTLLPGQRKNVTMIVDIDTTETGIFELTINGTVRDPKYNDWGKFYIEITEEDDILERIIFTEELIVGNPECAELKEVIDEARSLYESGKTQEAALKAEEALDACERAISQPPSKRSLGKLSGNIITYLSFASLIAIAIGLAYYYYRRIKLRKAMMGHQYIIPFLIASFYLSYSLSF